MKVRILTEKLIAEFSCYLKSEEKKPKHFRKIFAGCKCFCRFFKRDTDNEGKGHNLQKQIIERELRCAER